MHERKGIDVLIEAFGKVSHSHKNAHLYIIGANDPNPEMVEKYKQLAEKAASGRIIFCGSLDDPRPYLYGADVFVLPSRQEPAGLVISEAREAGCAVVGSNVGGIPEMLGNGRGGILVPPNDSAKLAFELDHLFSDSKYLAQWRKNSQINIENFSLERLARETEAVYEQVQSDSVSGKKRNALGGLRLPDRQMIKILVYG